MSVRDSAYGIDVDRVGPGEHVGTRLRRRMFGRYPVDAFGADPLLQDTIAAVADRAVVLDVRGGVAIPEIGPGVLVCNRRPGWGDPLVVRAAVRLVRHRRARVVGYPDLPLFGGAARRLGAVRSLAEDLSGVLRAGHLAVVSLAPSLRGHAGAASPLLLAGAVGYPVLPVAVTGGPVPVVGTGVGPHRLVVGAPLDLDVVRGDPLGAAELAEAARAAVEALLFP